MRPARVLLLAALVLAPGGCGPSDAESEGGEGGEGGGGFSLECDGEEPLANGLARCDDGFRHRASAPACPDVPTAGTCDEDALGGTCSVDADCTAAPRGRCVDDPSLLAGCGCVYACESDADCAEGEACACGDVTGSVPQCVPADCRTDADCDDGLCGVSVTTGGCGDRAVRLACLDGTAQCRTDSCAPVESCFEPDDPWIPSCRVVSGTWQCYDDACDGNCG